MPSGKQTLTDAEREMCRDAEMALARTCGARPPPDIAERLEDLAVAFIGDVTWVDPKGVPFTASLAPDFADYLLARRPPKETDTP